MIRTIFHFISEDGFEDYALTLPERDALTAAYQAAGASFIVKELPSESYDDQALYPCF
jgi:hypothetical protein